MDLDFVPENHKFLIPHTDNGVTKEWLMYCSDSWGARDAIQLYLVYLQIGSFFSKMK